ncbi:MULTISPECIES: hypothetical protein [unclassified Nodularia (in: cyanobacteria)]|uniref:hypothetical protein n=1 Tax=unclassified Nodularia (in: cyanobacteria) TaxID=2656917 RepID=UPI00187FC147|nr:MULTISPECIES: hypothetical protein [unclassified Nodularia (in: cyanobacteria)]MBE9199597.1 hypothetical protein [Nodularia sp. LEGE 06071]MCC2694926.1 hypothetical protein [Nodularia sp. LEGE 04288]
MNNPNPERLYNLIPAIYRIRDETQGGSLRALLGVIEQELETVETDIANLYENWFIETCDEWVVPYIGDLLAVTLYTEQTRTYGRERRAYVANTLAYRNRKGTAPVLEQLIADITGWRSRVVEFFKLVSTTQNLNNLQTNNVFADIRQLRQIDAIGTPFEESVAHTVEIRNISNQSGKYNIANIGIFLWRLKSYPIQRVTARQIKFTDTTNQGRCYTFNPLGINIHLFNQPQTETEITSLAAEINLPTSLRRLTLVAELEARRQLITDGRIPSSNGYFGNNPVLQVFLNHQSQSISPEYILIDNLSQWDKQDWQYPHIRTYQSSDGKIEKSFEIQAIVDPELGRLVVITKSAPQAVEVSYSYAFSGDIGGGTYDRSQGLSIPESISLIKWDVKQEIVRHTIQALANNVFASTPIQLISPAAINKKFQPIKPTFPHLATAIQEWNKNVKIWEYCEAQIYLELQSLHRNNQSQISLLNHHITTKFQPGIVNGLTVTAHKKADTITIASGTAVDNQGNRIYLGINYQVSLKKYANQTVFLVIFYQAATEEPKWQIKFIPPIEISSTTGIPLASLVINPIGQIENAETTIAPQFQPGIINGLEVKLVSPVEQQLQISPGKAVNSKATLIQIDKSYTLDFNINPNQNAILYITPKGKIDIVPDVEMGVITLRDNHTYQGNFTVTIPADKKLKIVAANERQPHLQGKLLVKGTARKNTNPGEIILDGLLVEGEVTILPGNLKELHIVNCTLLSKTAALTVEQAKRELESDTESDNDFTLLAIIIYFLSFIQQILILGIGDDSADSPNNLTKLFQLAFQKVAGGFSFLQKVTQEWQCLNIPDTDEQHLWELESNDEETDNTKLKVFIANSISGNILLADTVPQLEIVDSIIDKTWYKNDEVYQGNHSAITALGTNVAINRTTVFGRTNISTLEASNSIFNETVTVLRTQIGCVRFCYLPYGSRTPSRYRCQPDLALQKVANLPAKITSLAINHTTGKVFAGTAGKGISYLNNDSISGSIPLKQIYLFSLTVKSTFYCLMKYLLSKLGHSRIWQPINNNLTNQNVTKLLANIPTSIAGTDLILAGTTDGGIFNSIDNGETWNLSNTVIINGKLSPLVATNITALVAYNKSITGVIASAGIQITGEGTKFIKELRKHSLIIAADETRTITKISSDTVLEINEPFSSDLPAETTLKTQYILVGTGSGVFRSQDNSQNWEPINFGLQNRQIKELVVNHHNGDIFAGTEAGFYRSNNNGNFWTALNRDLPNRQVTALAINQYNGQIFIGTRDGIFRSQNDCQKWKPVNNGLTDTDITVLATYPKPGTGTISSNGTKITGIDTAFSTELAKGSVININNQTRTIIAIEENNTLIIDTAFNDDLPPQTTFSINYILAGTMGGNIFISQDHANSWKELTTSLTLTAITSFAINPHNQDIYAGTSAGNVLYSQNNGNNWISINHGFDGFDEQSIILMNYNPSFTSEKYGKPNYAQLSQFSLPEISTGAEDNSEMGAFNYLQQPQRETNLRASLNEYLRFGLEAGIFYQNEGNN